MALAHLAKAESLVEANRACVPRGDVQPKGVRPPALARVRELRVEEALAEPAAAEVRAQSDPHLDDARLRVGEVPEGVGPPVVALDDVPAVELDRRIVRRVVEVVRRLVPPLEDLVEAQISPSRSISTYRDSASRFTSRKPARRYARSARSFQLATQSRNLFGRHSSAA